MTISQLGIYFLLFMILAAFSFWMMKPRGGRPSRKLDPQLLAFNVSALVLGIGILMWSSAFRFEGFEEAGPGEIGGKNSNSSACAIFQDFYAEMFMGQGTADVTRQQRELFGSPRDPEFSDWTNLMKRSVSFREGNEGQHGAVPNPCVTPVDYSFLIPLEGMLVIGDVNGNNHQGFYSVIKSQIILNGARDLTAKVFHTDPSFPEYTNLEIPSSAVCHAEQDTATTICYVDFFVSEYPANWGDGVSNQYAGYHEIRFFNSSGDQVGGDLKFYGERFRR